MNYFKTVKTVTKKEGSTFKEVALNSGASEAKAHNFGVSLRKTYSKGFYKSMEPFKALGLEVEVKVTCSDGEEIIIE